MARSSTPSWRSDTIGGRRRHPSGSQGGLAPQITKQIQLLDEVWPAWPLRLKRLRAVIATAILPIVIPLVTR
jgi:hypothetical protein